MKNTTAKLSIHPISPCMLIFNNACMKKIRLSPLTTFNSDNSSLTLLPFHIILREQRIVFRFEKAVDAHFHCFICYNVLKEPIGRKVLC